MRKKNLNNEWDLILLCSRLSIDDLTQERIEVLLSRDISWEKVIDLSLRHETIFLLYHNLNRQDLAKNIPKNIFELMKTYYYENLRKNLLFEKDICLILKLAGQEGINLIPFKGFSLIHTLYHNPGLRPMVDIDILIKEGEFHKINDILTQIGYRQNTTAKHNPKYHYEINFSKMLSSNLYEFIEIHDALIPARPYKIDLPCLWERAHKITVNDQTMLCLSHEDTFLALALHLRRHTRRITLKFIVDIAELLNNHGEKLDWPYITKTAENNHIIVTVYLALYLSKELLEANVPAAVIGQFRPNILKTFLLRLVINKTSFLNSALIVPDAGSNQDAKGNSVHNSLYSSKHWRGTFLRFLLFDNLADFIIYLYKVSFLERFVNKQRIGKTKINVKKTPVITTIEKIKK